MGGKPWDRFFMWRFRGKLAGELGLEEGDFQPGYDGLMDLIAYLHSNSGSLTTVTERSRRTLNELFPDWPPGPPNETGLLWWFRILFARPFPAFSAKLNAWVTWWAAQWLMGPCELQDLDVVGGRLAAPVIPRGSSAPVVSDGQGQRLVVKRWCVRTSM